MFDRRFQTALDGAGSLSAIDSFSPSDGLHHHSDIFVG